LRASSGVVKQSSLAPVRVVADGGGEITVEFSDTATPSSMAQTSMPAMRVSIPPGCDEASIRRVLCAALSAVKGAARSEVASGATRAREGGPSC
jgi:hypothetical protein